MFSYDFGPYADFYIRFIGDMEKYNGSYEAQNDKEKYLVQVLCHAIYQVKEHIQNCQAGVFYYGNIYFHWIDSNNYENSYSVYTRGGMTVMHIVETGPYSFDFEFLSPRQLEEYGDDILDFAVQHANRYGRTL